MASLEDLARKKFTDPPLSLAEERVVRAASDGTFADCHDLGGGNDPEKANGTPEAPDEKWLETRNVRADLIRWLCVDREGREQVDPRGIWLGGARIIGPVDLGFSTIPFPLALLRCRLGLLILQGAKMTTLNLGGSWTEGIFADGFSVEGSLFLRNSFHAEGDVRLPGATIGGNLEATGGTFNNPKGCALNADDIKVRGSVLMKPQLNANGEIQSAFTATGEIRLLGAAIGSNLDAEGGTFRNLKSHENPNSTLHALSADRVKVTGSVFLSNGFSAEGEIRLVNATVGGDLNATGGTFRNPGREVLNADGISVGGNVFLKGGFVAAGRIRLPGAEIAGQLGVIDARLDALDLESACVMGPFFWRNIHKDSDPRFPNKEWKPVLNLTNAKVALLVDQEASWPEKGRLLLDGFVYDRIFAGLADEKVPTDSTARLRWLRLQPDEYGYLPQPYEQLIAVLRQMGHEHQVAQIAIAKQKDLYEHGDLGCRGKFRSWFLYLVVGYGYRAWLAFIWVLLLIVLGSFVFSRAHSSNVLVPSDKDAYSEYEKSKMEKLPPYYPDFHASFYSLDVVLPFDLGQKSSWRLIERWPSDNAYWIYEFYSIGQLFIGWVLLIVAAAVPAGLIKKD
jgi:hypothetical protein